MDVVDGVMVGNRFDHTGISTRVVACERPTSMPGGDAGGGGFVTERGR